MDVFFSFKDAYPRWSSNQLPHFYWDGVQGSGLSPTQFNLFLHDIPTPTSQGTKILSSADDITITSTHAKHNTGATNAQHYLNTLHIWLTTNRLRVAPEKSTATLITNYNWEHILTNLTPVTLYNTPIPYTNEVRILGVIYYNGLTVKEHIADLKQKVHTKTFLEKAFGKALKVITGQEFGQSKETTTTIYKQFIRSTAEYYSTSWSPNLSDTHYRYCRTTHWEPPPVIPKHPPPTTYIEKPKH